MLRSNILRRRAWANVSSFVRPRYTSTASGPSTASSSSPSLFRYLGRVSLISSTAFIAYTLGSLYPPSFASFLSPRIAPPPPDPDHPHTIAYVEELEDKLQKLPLLAQLRLSADTNEWYETRPYIAVPKSELVNSLTAGSLRGPAKLALPPLVRARKDEQEAIAIIHVGTALCGHEGIVHGGLLATLLDESLGRISLLNLPDKIGVTAHLALNYRSPTRADQFLIIKTRVDEKKGRKVKVSGVIEDVDGNTLVEAQALFVQPRYAKLLNPSKLHARLGHPPADPKEPPIEGSLAPSPAIPRTSPKAISA